MEMVRLIWKDRPTRVALFFLALFFAMAALSFVWTPYDYRAQDLAASRQGPSLDHWFGTDIIGRDMFTRVLYSTRITVFIMLLTAFFGGLPLSIILGVVAGYFGRKVDWIIMRVGELAIGVPSLLFILLITATFRPRYDSFLFGLGALGEWADEMWL